MLGAANTPAIAGNARYDLHRLMMVGASSSTAYKLRALSTALARWRRLSLRVVH